MTPGCDREADVVRVVLAGGWPEGCDASLREHVEHCDVCRDVVTIAEVLGEEHRTMRRTVGVPSAGQVWWRSAVRARLEATQAAARPLTWLYSVVAALVVMAIVLVVAANTSRVGMWTDGVEDWVAAHVPDTQRAAASFMDLAAVAVQPWLPLLVVLGLCLVAAPIALFFALRD